MIDYGAWGGVRWSISDTGRLVLRPIKNSDYDSTTQHNLISKDLGNPDLGMLPSGQPINPEDYGKLPRGDINHTILPTAFPWQLYSSSIKEVFAELGENDMPIKAIGDMKCLFSGLSQIVTARTFSGMNSFSTVEQEKMMGLENIDWSEATSLSHLFSGSIIEDSIYSYLEDHELELINIIQPNITDVSYMFEGCTGLGRLILRQVNPRNNITHTTGMFFGCTNLYDINTDIYFDCLIHMSEMFYNCQNLHYVPFLSDSNLSSLNHAQNTFDGCTNLEEIQLGAKYILTLDTEIDEEKTYYEYEGEELKIVTDPKEEFLHLYFEKTAKAPLEAIDYMFSNCQSLVKIYNLDNLDTSNVEWMDGIFTNCSQLKELNLSNFDTSSATSMCEMFDNCQSLTELDLSNFNTSNVTDMSYLFEDCINLTALNISSFRTPKVEYMNNMFKNCQSLTSLNLSGFSFTNTTNISYMFNNCINLNTLIFDQNLDTSHITNMNYTFSNCQALEELPSSFKLGGNNFTQTFYNCINLKGKIYTNPAKSALYTKTFDNTTKNIYLIDIPVSNYSTWKSMVKNYDNVHYNAEDVSNPTVIINNIKRVDSEGKTKPNGDYILVEIILTLYTNNLPEGWEAQTFAATVNGNLVQMYNPPTEIPSIEENQKVYKCNYLLYAPPNYSLNQLTITQTIISEEV